MIDDELHDEDSSEPGTIGVGMGGSCPTCRAPVDLGQEFCLECGAPIRFTPKQRQKRGTRRPAAAGAAPPPRPGSGFPWVPFLIVLALVGGVFALSLVDNGDSNDGDRTGETTEEALPDIQSEPPTTTESDTQTTTLEDCDPTRPLDGTQPAVDDGFDEGGLDESIPEFDSGLDDPTSGGFDDPGVDSDVPPLEPDDDAGTTVTVDQNGDLCEDGGGSGVDPTTTDTGSDDKDATTSASGDWPEGRNGWTVIVAGYPNDQSRAQQRAADVQEDGFADSGVLFSSEYTSLCPGFYVVYSGVFSAESEAEARRRQLAANPDYAGMYVREIRTGGSAASGCSTVSS